QDNHGSFHLSRRIDGCKRSDRRGNNLASGFQSCRRKDDSRAHGGIRPRNRPTSFPRQEKDSLQRRVHQP
uniref:hypothetical protein n=1 Tax=Candidatus Limisoma sp. TaxID=3076476 RepID=UPI0040286A6C